VSRHRAPVVVVGDANIDLLVRLPAERGRGQQPPPELSLGGTAANTAAALARLGQPVALIGTVGDDGYGRYLSQQLAALGVGVTGLSAVPDAFTMMVLAIVDGQGERTLLGWPRRGGAQGRLRSAGLDLELIRHAAWLHTTGICLVEAPARETILLALSVARAAGVPTSIDLNLRLGLEQGRLPTAFRQALLAAIAHASVVLGSASDELPWLASGEEAVTVARQLTGPDRVVVARLGEQGALLVAGSELCRASAFAVEVASTVGAGDAFNAGLILAAADGRSLAEALDWGNAVAALAIEQVDRLAGLSRGRVAALLRQRGYAVDRWEEAT
jgi:sugar/nucleoside kinase (ribokinase family)